MSEKPRSTARVLSILGAWAAPREEASAKTDYGKAQVAGEKILVLALLVVKALCLP